MGCRGCRFASYYSVSCNRQAHCGGCILGGTHFKLTPHAFIFVCSRMDDGSERMYYTGQGSDGSTSIGVAKLPFGAGPNAWVREQATFAFE
jgi:hypothetical protein